MATVPVTRTWTAGEIVTAGHFNLNIRDVLNFLLAPPICQVRQLVTQSPVNNTWTPITFTAEDVDTSGMHSTVSNTDRLTAVYPGWYDVSGAVPWATSATGIRGGRWTVNGTAVTGAQALSAAGTSNVTSKPGNVLIYLNVGDILRLEGIQTSGGALATVVVSDSCAVASVRWRSN